MTIALNRKSTERDWIEHDERRDILLQVEVCRLSFSLIILCVIEIVNVFSLGFDLVLAFIWA